jgi:hypothetical protein
VAISIAVEPALLILISVCYLVVGPLLVISHALLRVERAKLFPISEPNAHHVDFGSGEIAFANEAKLEQNFVTGLAAYFTFPFDPAFLAMRGPQRFKPPAAAFVCAFTPEGCTAGLFDFPSMERHGPSRPR